MKGIAAETGESNPLDKEPLHPPTTSYLVLQNSKGFTGWIRLLSNSCVLPSQHREVYVLRIFDSETRL